MRILQIRFKNLNSLRGEWELDLTHPAYGADGIFAITGPTGAGKSTILDALCLALYGRTPRLDSINKSGNELMSRQTGDCLAEVTFETDAGRFRCHWAQHRARSRAGGLLQSQRHEIVEASSGEILESRIKDVAARVETVTGMSFMQFTRSMLLAQGGFAAFLQAGSDERASILEQLTGSGIYSSISSAVHERRSVENRRLEELEAALSGLDLLTAEAEAGLLASREALTARGAALADGIAARNREIAWRGGIVALEEELGELARGREGWQVRREAFEPERQRLEAANRALELAADHRELVALRQAHASELEALRCGRELFPVLEAAHAEAVAVDRTSEAALGARLQEQQAAQPLLRQVRELDLQLTGKAAQIADQAASISDGEAQRATLALRQARETALLEGARCKAAALSGQLDATQADEGLVEHLAGLRGRIEALQGIVGRQAAQAAELTTAEAELAAATRTWQGQVAALGVAAGVMQDCASRLDGRRLEAEARLQGRTLPDWRRLHATAAEGVNLLERALETIRSLAGERRLEAEQAALVVALTADARVLSGSLEERQLCLEGLDHDLELVETQLTLLRKIAELEEQRSGLRDGEPCPLCGAREHPFALGNVPAQDQTRQNLSALRARRKDAAGELAEGRVKLARLEKDLEQATAVGLACAGRIEEARLRLAGLGDQMSFDWRPSGDEETDPGPGLLEGRLVEERAALVRIAGLIEAAELDQREIAQLQASLEQAREAHGVAQREMLTAQHRQDMAQRAVEGRKSELDQTCVSREEALSRLRGELAPYGFAETPPEALLGVLDDLTGRRDRRLALFQEKVICERELAALEERTRQQAEQLAAWHGDLERKRGQLERLVLERQELASLRADVFGERLPDQEEGRLATAVEDALRSRETTRQSLAGARLALDSQRERLEQLAGTVARRQPLLQASGAGFAVRLAEAGFSDEAAFGAACLEESDRRHLADRWRGLSEQSVALAAQEGEKTARLEAERGRALSEESPEALAASLELLTGQQQQLQQEIGGIQRRLKDNGELKTTQLARALAREAQRRECARWNRLHDLVGSSDGKKFRNFAQGLTFEVMVAHANDQLRKISDRYLLVRDPEKPLELNVIDNWQAGEIRSTKNLSGGESFLVSLALALGLSRMASRKVRVDSLFLDEGFGTLDEEALESALVALAGLRRDGKLIGVISHVEALKERIGVQVRVTPLGGGRSELSGPGCRSLDVFHH